METDNHPLLSQDAYLAHSEWIDWQHPSIQAKAASLANGLDGDETIAKACFEFVRDHIKHSSDFKLNPVTCKASDVLKHNTGYCYAKSHLLAALCRANGIPTGLCYQRLTIQSDQPPFCLHGLNAIYLKEYGWYRVDARGNKAGVNAQFSPPVEQLAFELLHPDETLFEGIYGAPLDAVTHCLTQHQDWLAVLENLPDADNLDKPAT